MAIQNLYPYLPGHLVEFKDGGFAALKPEQNPPKTDSVLILGTATDGPSMTPVAVDPSTASIFGKLKDDMGIPNGASLLRGFEEVYQAGCRDVRLMRISGQGAKLVVEGAPIQHREETGFEEVFAAGTKGNDEATFTVSKFPFVEVVEVKADAEVLEVTALTVDGTAGTVILPANICKAGSLITIKYKQDPVGSGIETDYVTYTENYTANVDGTVTDWVAAGSDAEYDLTHAPLAETSRVIIAGSKLPYAHFTIDTVNKKLIIKAAARLTPGLDITIQYTYDVVSTVVPEIQLETPWGGSVYNQTFAYVENEVNAANQVVGKKLIINMPAAKVGQNAKPLEYSSTKYPTFNALVQAINLDLDNGAGVAKARCNKAFENLLTKNLSPMGQTYFAGGQDGINLTKQQLFEALGGKKDPVTGEWKTLGAYNLLENYKVDLIVPMDVYSDDKLPNPENSFAHQLGMACFVISTRSRVTHGIIATNSPEDTSLQDILTHTKNLVQNYPNDFYMKDDAGNLIYDEEGNPFDLGKFCTVHAGPDVNFRHNVLGQYSTNSAAVLAGMISALPVSSSPLNKPVPGIRGLRYTYGNSQLNALTGARFVTYSTEDNGASIICTDWMTAAHAGSDYSMGVNWRSVKKAVDEVRAACRPFIGEAPSVANQNAMGSAIDKKIEAMKGNGDVTNVKFEIIASTYDRVLGRSKIKLTVTPPGTLREITTVVEVSPF